MPFGGVKDSGWGRFGGTFAMDEFTELQVGHGAERHAAVPVLMGREGAPMAEVVSLSEAVAELVHDGDAVALEGFTHLIPHAAGHELIRQGRAISPSFGSRPTSSTTR